MRNPFRFALNVGVAAIAALALAPVVFAPTPAYARGGGGGRSGGRSGGGNKGGSKGGGKVGGSKAGGKAGKSGTGTNGAAKNIGEYLIQIQRIDADDHRPDFLFDARDFATVDERDKDRAAALAANRENESRQLRADDLPRP